MRKFISICLNPSKKPSAAAAAAAAAAGGRVTDTDNESLQLAAESRAALPRNLSPHHLSSEKSFQQILHVHTNDVD